MSRLHELNNMGKALQNLITYLYLVDRFNIIRLKVVCWMDVEVVEG